MSQVVSNNPTNPEGIVTLPGDAIENTQPIPEGTSIAIVPDTHIKPSAPDIDDLTMDQLMSICHPNNPTRHTFVSGTVAAITSEGALISLGTKSDSLVPAEEVLQFNLQVGQTGTFMVLTDPDEDGSSRLSFKVAHGWQAAQKMFDNGTPGTGIVTSVVRKKEVDEDTGARKDTGYIAGVLVELHGVRGFVPASQCTVHGLALKRLVGTQVPVKVITCDFEGRKLILSQKQAVEELRKALYDSLKPGQVVSGMVTNIVDFGAFVELGDGVCVSGLIHKSEISNDRSLSPGEVVKVGQSLVLLVLAVDAQGHKVSLSLKQATQAKALSVLSEGIVVNGTVARLTDYGAFIDLDGIDGLLHNSQLPDGVRNVRDILQPGQKIRVKVIELKAEVKKVALSMRDVPPEDEPQPEDTESISMDPDESAKHRAEIIEALTADLPADLKDMVSAITDAVVAALDNNTAQTTNG